MTGRELIGQAYVPVNETSVESLVQSVSLLRSIEPLKDCSLSNYSVKLKEEFRTHIPVDKPFVQGQSRVISDGTFLRW